MSNPIERYFELYGREEEEDQEKEAQVPVDRGSLQHREIQLWNQWNQSGRRPEALRPIVRSLAPIIQKETRTYAGIVPIPPSAIEAEFKNQAVKAVKSFDPSHGTQLSTWVHANIKKGTRFIRTHQNVGRIVESRIDKITQLKAKKQELADALGRPATEHEISSSIGWSPAEVKRLNMELRNDILSSKFESDPDSWSPKVDDEIFAHLAEELTPEERQVFTHIQQPEETGGRTGNIATALNWSPSKVSRHRKSIQRKAEDIRTVLTRQIANPYLTGKR